MVAVTSGEAGRWGGVDASVRAVWRALDRSTRRELDDAVSAGRAVPRTELATVGVWRALRRRREWTLAALFVLCCGAAAALLLPPAGLLVVAALLLPVERMWRLHLAIDANVALAVTKPQRTSLAPRRPRSELDRRLSDRG